MGLNALLPDYFTLLLTRPHLPRAIVVRLRVREINFVILTPDTVGVCAISFKKALQSVREAFVLKGEGVTKYYMNFRST